MTAFGSFLVFAAVMASLAGSSLLCPGTPLDRMWVLNRPAYAQLAPLGRPAGLFFLSLAAALALAAAGWIKRRRWGWWLAVAILGTQVLGDVVSLFFGRTLQGLAGVTIAGALLFFITRQRVREAFAAGPNQIVRVGNP